MEHDLLSRRNFIGGALALGGVALLASNGLQVINGPANPDGLMPAVRLNPPKQPAFSPWEAGETIYEVPNG